jgi:hypothetical protein
MDEYAAPLPLAVSSATPSEPDPAKRWVQRFFGGDRKDFGDVIVSQIARKSLFFVPRIATLASAKPLIFRD